MERLRRAGILGLGAFVPEKILTNFDLEKMVETTDEWIRTRTGIQERRISEKGTPTSDLASEAAKEAISSAGLKPTDIDLIICATITPDMLFPSTACVVQHKIGAKCPGFDISAACSGFLYALSMAEGLIRSGAYNKILVIGAEVLSSFINWKDRSTCVLFGDGAGAAVIGAVDEGSLIISSKIGADGAQAQILKIPGGGSAIPTSKESLEQGKHFVYMEGQEVFKAAVRAMSDAIVAVSEASGMQVSDIDCLVPHQANMRILQAVSSRTDIPEDRIFVNLHRYGNMSAASTAVALYEAVKEGKIKKNSKVVLVAFGSGLTWAAASILW